MATVTWSRPLSAASSYADYGFNLKDVLAWAYGYASNMSATSFEATVRVAYTATVDVYKGTFTYIENEVRGGIRVSPYIKDGVITDIVRYYQGEFVGSISGLSLDYNSVVAAAKTGSPEDDRTLFYSAFAGDDALVGSRGNDTFEGFDGNDQIVGGAGSDTLDGGTGSDSINGGSGNDKLLGSIGNDIITGGAGADKLYGGADADRFVFALPKDSTVKSSGRDTIYDFSSRQKDKIDLKAIDANTKAKGNQAFKFIDKQDFHKKAGELRWEKVKSGAYVHGDVNGDGEADFSFFLKGVSKVSKGDFFL